MDLLVRVESICNQESSDRLLRERLIALLRERLPFAGHVFGLTDPVTGVGSSPHATVPMLAWEELPGLIRRRYLASSTAEWRALLAPLGVTDTALVMFTDRYGTWGWLELWRTTGAYDDRDRALLERLAGSTPAGSPICSSSPGPRPRTTSRRCSRRPAHQAVRYSSPGRWAPERTNQPWLL